MNQFYLWLNKLCVKYFVNLYWPTANRKDSSFKDPRFSLMFKCEETPFFLKRVTVLLECKSLRSPECDVTSSCIWKNGRDWMGGRKRVVFTTHTCNNPPQWHLRWGTHRRTNPWPSQMLVKLLECKILNVPSWQVFLSKNNKHNSVRNGMTRSNTGYNLL